MNEIVAVVQDIEDASAFNAKKAIAELSKVRNWEQMIGLIERHCVNDLFIHVRDVFRGISRIDSNYRALIREMPGKSLSETLLGLDMPDYLDGIDSHWCFSCPSDYQEKGFGFLPVCDLLAFRHVLMGITRTGAVALGFPPPDGLCSFFAIDNLPKDELEFFPWTCEEFEPDQIIIKINAGLSGYSKCGMLEEEQFMEADEDSSSYSRWGTSLFSISRYRKKTRSKLR